MSNRIISAVLDEPDAYILLQDIHKALDDEKTRRIAFYNEITEQQKIEFINGEIIEHSPAMKRHNTASLLLASLMSIYAGINNLGFVGIEKIMITLTRNDYERSAAAARHLFLQERNCCKFQRKTNAFSCSKFGD